MAYMSLPEKEFPIAHHEFTDPILTKEKFVAQADNFRSPHLWEQVNGQWRLRHAVWHGAKPAR